MRVAAARGGAGRTDRRCGYLGHELEAEEGGALVLEVLLDLQFLTERAMRCHDRDPATCTCRRKEGEGQVKGDWWAPGPWQALTITAMRPWLWLQPQRDTSRSPATWLPTSPEEAAAGRSVTRGEDAAAFGVPCHVIVDVRPPAAQPGLTRSAVTESAVTVLSPRSTAQSCFWESLREDVFCKPRAWSHLWGVWLHTPQGVGITDAGRHCLEVPPMPRATRPPVAGQLAAGPPARSPDRRDPTPPHPRRPRGHRSLAGVWVRVTRDGESPARLSCCCAPGYRWWS